MLIRCRVHLLALTLLVLFPLEAFAKPRRLPGMGSHRRTVTTDSRAAQRWFDQGLVLAMSFNHDEAIRSFAEAARLDSGCAMAWWSMALANGPHINNAAMTPEQSRDAWKSHGADPDVGWLCAEALMDLRPWDLWESDGSLQPGTDEFLATLDRVLALDADHPGANHLLVHAVEASPHPDRGLAAADRLTRLVPGAGHMAHMPAHICSRVGRWADASAANVRAIEADRRYRALSPRQGFSNVYMMHNHHFLAWASQMQGRSAEALAAARAMIANAPVEFVREMALFADGYMNIEIETLMRFGRWAEILAVPEPPDHLPVTRAFRRFARGTALAALGRVDEAEREQAAFRQASGAVTEAMFVGNNPARLVLSIAEHQLAGEIMNRRGDVDGAVRELREAVRLEDSLRYNESPDWLLPVRHALGAVLVRAKRWSEAGAIYRGDLARNAENGGSPWGLASALRAQGRGDEAAAVDARFRAAWKPADVTLASTCYCQVWD